MKSSDPNGDHILPIRLTKRHSGLFGFFVAVGVLLAVTALVLTSAVKAQVWSSDCADYDANGDGQISRDESMVAIRDYFGGVIDRTAVFNVIDCYFSPPTPAPLPTSTPTSTPTPTPTPTPTITAPGPVQQPSFTPGDRRFTATWSPPADDGGSSISSYDVQYSDPDSSQWIGTKITETTNLSLTVSGLINGEPYNVQIRANNQNDNGAGPWLNAGTVTQ